MHRETTGWPATLAADRVPRSGPITDRRFPTWIESIDSRIFADSTITVDSTIFADSMISADSTYPLRSTRRMP